MIVNISAYDCLDMDEGKFEKTFENSSENSLTYLVISGEHCNKTIRDCMTGNFWQDD